MPPEPKKDKPVLIVGGMVSNPLIQMALDEMKMSINDVIVVTPETAKDLEKERGITITTKEDPFDTTPVFPFHALPRLDDRVYLTSSYRSNNYITGKKLPRKNKKRK